MAIFLNNIKRFSLNKGLIAISLIIPIIFIIVSFIGMGSQKATIGVIDKDETPLTERIAETLKDQATVVSLSDENQQDQLINGHVDLVLKLDQGYTSSMLSGQPIPLTSYHVSESNVSDGLRSFIDSYLEDIRLIALRTDGNQASFYQAMDQYAENRLHLSVRSGNGEAEQKERTLRSLGFIVYGCLLMMIQLSSKLIVEDKEKKVMSRFFTTPLSIKWYNLQHILSSLVLANITIILMLSILTVVFHASFGPSLFNIYLVLLLFSLVSIAIGVALSTCVSTTRQVYAFSALINVPLAMLGGCFWPLDVMPEFMQRVAAFTPTGWGIKALTKLVYGNGLNAVIMDLSILIAFAAAIFLLASWRRPGVAR